MEINIYEQQPNLELLPPQSSPEETLPYFSIPSSPRSQEEIIHIIHDSFQAFYRTEAKLETEMVESADSIYGQAMPPPEESQTTLASFFFTLETQRQELQTQVFSEEVMPLLSALWAEYPTEENQILAQEVIARYYQNIAYEIEAIELEEETGDYLVHFSIFPLCFPDYLKKNYLQENFNEVSKNAQMAHISLERYIYYDNLACSKILQELLIQEESPHSTAEEYTLRLQHNTEGYTIDKSDWFGLHNLLFQY